MKIHLEKIKMSYIGNDKNVLYTNRKQEIILEFNIISEEFIINSKFITEPIIYKSTSFKQIKDKFDRIKTLLKYNPEYDIETYDVYDKPEYQDLLNEICKENNI